MTDRTRRIKPDRAALYALRRERNAPRRATFNYSGWAMMMRLWHHPDSVLLERNGVTGAVRLRQDHHAKGIQLDSPRRQMPILALDDFLPPEPIRLQMRVQWLSAKLGPVIFLTPPEGEAFLSAEQRRDMTLARTRRIDLEHRRTVDPDQRQRLDDLYSHPATLPEWSKSLGLSEAAADDAVEAEATAPPPFEPPEPPPETWNERKARLAREAAGRGKP